MASPVDMTEYRTMAENALRASRATGSRRVVSNRGPEHARAVTDVLVTSAEQHLAFLCGYFSSDIFDASKTREFLDGPGAQMSVLLDHMPDAAHRSALSELGAYMVGDDPKLRVRRLEHPATVHFGIADDRDVRIETDTQSRKATVVFGDPAVARSASRKFKSLWDAAVAVTPQELGASATR